MNLQAAFVGKRMQSLLIFLVLASFVTPLPIVKADTKPKESKVQDIQKLIPMWRMEEHKTRPLSVRGRFVTERSKEVRTWSEQGWHLMNPSQSTRSIPLHEEVAFEWLYDGEDNILSKYRVEFPRNISKFRPETEAEAPWELLRLWDGNQSVNIMYLNPSVTDPVEVTVVNTVKEDGDQKLAKHIQRLKASAAQIGSELLLCSPNGATWSEFFEKQAHSIAQGTWNKMPCLLFTWKQSWNSKTESTVYIVPSRSFAAVRRETRDESGEITKVTDVKLLELHGDMWLPKRVEKTLFADSHLFGSHVVKSTTNYSIETITPSTKLQESTFKFNAELLPVGSKVRVMGGEDSDYAYYVGAAVDDADIFRLADSLAKYVAGQVPLDHPLDIIPVKKRFSSPKNCGPYSLMILGQIIGKPFSFKDAVKLAGTDTEGISSFAGLTDALKAKGVEAKAYEMDIAELRKIPLPAVLHVEPEHFVILLSFEQLNTAVILDPPTKIIALPMEELVKIWTKQVLVVNGTERVKASTEGNTH